MAATVLGNPGANTGPKKRIIFFVVSLLERKPFPEAPSRPLLRCLSVEHPVPPMQILGHYPRLFPLSFISLTLYDLSIQVLNNLSPTLYLH